MIEPTPFIDGYRLIDGTELNDRLANPNWSTSPDFTATAGGSVSTSAKIVATVTQVANAAAPGAGVTLPQALPGRVFVIINDSPFTITVYADGGSDISGAVQIPGNIGVSQEPAIASYYIAVQVDLWYRLDFYPIGFPNKFVEIVQDINALRLWSSLPGTSPAIVSLIYNNVPGDGGGLFYLDAADHTSPDNGTTIIVDAVGNRWKRQLVEAVYIASTPSGNILDTNVQDVITGLGSSGGAALIGNTPSGNVAATDVQAAINELDTEKVSYVNLAATTGAGLVGFEQPFTGAEPVTAADKFQQFVCIEDFFPIGFNPVTGDCTPYIQAALDSSASALTVYANPGTYRITDSIYIRGDYKVLDMRGGVLYFDGAVNNTKVVVIDNPNTPTTLSYFQTLKNTNLLFSPTARNLTNCVGLYITGGVLHCCTENVWIRFVGYGSGSGQGVWIEGGPVGANDTPYYGTHINLKVLFCNVGIYVQAAGGYPVITTQNFFNVTSGGNLSHGMWFDNAQDCNLYAPMTESNGGANIRTENSGTIFVFGGFNEGGNPNVEYINTNPNFGNVILYNAYPTTTVSSTSYYDLPALGFQSSSLLLARYTVPSFSLALNDTIRLSFPGTLEISTGDGAFISLYLYNDTVTGWTAEVVNANAGAPNIGVGNYKNRWTINASVAGQLCIYYDAGLGYFVLENLSGTQLFSMVQRFM